VKRLRKKQKQRPLAALLDKNPVLATGLNLPFLIVTSVSLRAAAAMSLELLLIHMGTVIAALVTAKRLRGLARPMVLVAVSTLIMTFARILVIGLFQGVGDTLGMYLYLMAVNGMTLAQCAAIDGDSKIYPAVTGAFMNVAGFAVVIFAVSFLREYFASGSLWGYPVPTHLKLPGVTVPFFGFILTGFLMAGARLLNKCLISRAVKERERREKRLSVI
jgi:Na+-transporting NADH:ubiquinone oxidoreductase subunit NqrD